MNNSDAVAPSLRSILSSFQHCFTDPSFQNFIELALGWIACQGLHTISRVIQASVPSPSAQRKHHSIHYRFLSHARWVADSLGKTMFFLLLEHLSEVITVLVDDTLCKKTGPHVFGAGMHFDAVSSTYGRNSARGRKTFFAFGHNWVVLSIWVPLPWGTGRGIAAPVLFRLYRSKKLCPSHLYQKRTELAREIINLFCSWLPPERSICLVGDNEYSCKTVARDLPPAATLTGSMNMNAALYAPPGPYKGRGRKPLKGKKLPSPQQLAALNAIPWQQLTITIYGKEVSILIKTLVCLWYSVTGTKPVRVVITRDPKGTIDDRAYFCTDDESSAEQLLIHFARRWEIEVTFRNTKQIIGIQDPQNGWWRRNPKDPPPPKQAGPNPHDSIGHTAIVHTVSLSFTAYGIVILWYLKHGDYQRDVERIRTEAPWYRHKLTPSFMDMLAAVRREIWLQRFSSHPLLNRVPRKILDFLPQCLLNAA